AAASPPLPLRQSRSVALLILHRRASTSALADLQTSPGPHPSLSPSMPTTGRERSNYDADADAIYEGWEPGKQMSAERYHTALLLIDKLVRQLSDFDKLVHLLDHRDIEMDKQLQQQAEKIEQLEEEIWLYGLELADKREEINSKDAALRRKDEEIKRRTKKLNFRKNTLKDKNALLALKDKEVIRQSNKIAELGSELRDRDGHLRVLEQRVTYLKEAMAEQKVRVRAWTNLSFEEFDTQQAEMFGRRENQSNIRRPAPVRRLTL
ncbi:hypothetical protein IWZ00DRAFT_565190, partial [Phyllosticta capitalensis]